MYYLCSENKGADQLRGYREADLRLCFRICKKLVFSRRGSNFFYCRQIDGLVTVMTQHRIRRKEENVKVPFAKTMDSWLSCGRNLFNVCFLVSDNGLSQISSISLNCRQIIFFAKFCA